MSRLSALVSAIALAGALGSTCAEAVQRSFVASYGSDANTASNCGFTSPCRSFTAAHSVTDPNGEIVAIDAAGYGAITITKSITITSNPGFYAGISASTGSAVTIATAGVKVTLRGLNINSVGAPTGINMSAGDRLSVENCVISNFATYGIFVATAATVRIVDSMIRDNNEGVWIQNGVTASISGSKFLGNSDAGIVVWADATGQTTMAAVSDSVMTGNYSGLLVGNTPAGSTTYASVTRSNVSNNTYGLYSWDTGGTSIVTVSYSQITGNSNTGLYNYLSGSIIRSQGNNTIDQNVSNTSGTITPLAGS